MTPVTPTAPKDLRPAPELDDLDRRLLTLLRENSRMTNQALSERLGIAPSTCLARMKTLQRTGVIRRFTVEVDPRALGRGIEALISVRLRAGARHLMSSFSEGLKEVPEVSQFFFLAGADDFLIHVVARDTDHIRQFVLEHLSSNQAVAATQTSLVFEHVHGSAEL
ncbi:Lrp/AsnC family transcriptional regulator [Kocuria sp. M1R5S2]|uniref:Lrp/AsnC family transcriptional regulator n=1 Tax=Kocuria rhizosphaerae TaxID=3376285 RepID=UPI00378B1C7A